MTAKEFLNSLARSKSDILQRLLDILSATVSDYCVIGGLAVNAYVEPVVSMDVDIVVAARNIGAVANAAKAQGLKVEEYAHSINISSPGSDLRIQIQTDPRYQIFLANAKARDVLGYMLKVASLKDVLQGKIWAYTDDTRRRSKRQKDLADIFRIMETYPEMADNIPQDLKEELSDK